jgi:hypothetical protein
MSASMLARLMALESTARRDAAHVRALYRKTGMSAWEVAYYGARSNWPDAYAMLRARDVIPY